jgi:quercetin dioxygenase-like cupin family protein
MVGHLTHFSKTTEIFREKRRMKAVHVRAAEVANQAGSQRAWGSQVWMANHTLTGSSLALARIILAVGRLGEPHRHPNADEVIYSIKGQVAVHVGSEVFALGASDALTIPRGLSHRVENVGTESEQIGLKL